ncbi:hypothetical protein HIMB59_00008160 [alpha proteobacterium HIMB59]|nr:hypothetical protein HIMB59_00008160 [alpha proteobacterium HIMB59]
MKKIKIITLIVFLLVLILVALSFFKLPINTITNANIMEQTNNTVSLTSSEEQSLILLPKPQIEIKEANFSVQNDLLSADLITKNVMFSRSLLDSNNISISIPNASIGNLNINALENEVLLEGEIENLDLNISSNENTTEIFSDTFFYKEAEVQFDAFIEDEVLKKLNFSIQELDVNELVLLLDKNYQKFFKQINLDTINVSGEYTQNNFSINNLELNFNENSQLKFSGLINLENFLNSKLNIKGFNIPFEVFSQFLQNINFLNSTKLPKGNLDNFDIEYSDLIKINSLNYLTENGSELDLQGSFNYIDFLDTNFDLNLNSSSSNDISNFFQLIFPKLDSNLIRFDKLSLSSNIENENIKIKELNISKDETLISILGDFNLDNFSNRGLQIKINNFKEFDLIPNVEIKEILNQLNISHFTMDGAVINEEIIINSLDVFEEDELKLSLSGETNLSNTQQTFLNINLQQFDSNDLSKLLKYTDQDEYAKYLDLYLFSNVEGNLIIDLATGNYVLENIEITQDENISTLSGNIFDEKFSGNLSLKNLDLENMEKFFLESSRLKGFLDLNLDISQPIDLNNMIGISGKINGQVKINVKEDEIALLLFMQSLSQDIEDFEQINQLINTLSQSFINNDISIEGEVTNSNNKELIIKDLIFTSSDNQELKGEIEYFHPNYKITIFDIIEQDDFIIKFDKGSYSYERVIPDGTVRKPLEELIQKNINKLFENLLQ